MATMAAIKDSPTTTAALWQHHILAALPPRDSEEYAYSKLMQDVALGIHALTAAVKKQAMCLPSRRCSNPLHRN